MLSVMRTAGLLAVAASAAGAWAAPAEEIPRLAWRTSLQSADREYELRAAAISADGSSLWVGVASRPRGTIGGPEKLILTSIAGAGKPTGLVIDASADASLADLTERRGLLGMSAGRDRAIVLGLDRRSAGIGVATLDAVSGRIAAARPLAFDSGKPELARLVPMPDGRILTVGTLGTRPFVAALSADGTVAWQRVLDQENVNLDDGAPTTDGGVMVIGRQGADPSATRVWVAKLSAKGEVEREAAFDGWLGSIAQGTGGGYLLAITDRARAASVTLTGLGPALETRWTRPMPAGQPATPAFRVRPIRGGGYIVAGIKDRGLWVARIGDDGTPVWTDAQSPAPPQVETALNVELLSRDEAFFVVYTVFAIDGKEQRQLVRVIRFAA
jgi:hypothetical protein